MNEIYNNFFSYLDDTLIFLRVDYNEFNEPIDYVFENINDKAADFLGKSHAEIQGKSVYMFYPNLDKQYVEIIKKIFKQDKVVNEMVYDVLKKIYFNVKGVKVSNSLIGISIREIGEIEAFIKENKYIESMFEYSPNKIFIINAQGVVEYANSEYSRYKGYTLESMLNLLKTEEKLEFNIEDIYSNAEQNLVLGSDWSKDIKLKDKDGKSKWIHFKVSKAVLRAGESECFVAFLEDITPTIEAKEKLHLREVENAENLIKLSETEQRLIEEDKLANIGQLSAGIAHEINNPLGYVMSNFETLKKYILKFQNTIMSYREFQTKLPKDYSEIKVEDGNSLDFIIEDMEELFKDTEEGLERVRKIVKALRAFSRSDKLENFEEYDLNSGIENSILIARNEFKYNAEVETEFNDLPMIQANSGQINQVILNLIINASYAIKEKNLDKMGVIKLKTYKDDEYVYLRCEDNGIGIKEENLKNVFKPFFTTKPIGKGTGLGLSISYDLIKNKHNGEISVESKKNEYTAFTIKLPITQKE